MSFEYPRGILILKTPEKIWEAASGLAIQLPTGAVMLLADARALLSHPLMVAKLALVALALANVRSVHRAAGPSFAGLDGPIPARVHLGALASLVAWPAVALLGRAIAYF